MNNQRRILLKGSLAAGALGVAVGSGLLTPRKVLAAWPEEAFGAKTLDDAVKAITGADEMAESADVKLGVPEIAENGAVVPVKVSTSITGVESISVIAVNNPSPLVASFALGEGAEGFVSTRIKMGKSGDVVAVVKADGKVYSAKKEVKVTIGGCGG